MICIGTFVLDLTAIKKWFWDHDNLNIEMFTIDEKDLFLIWSKTWQGRIRFNLQHS